MAAATALTVAVSLVPTAALVGATAPAHAAPEGMGFHLNATDLRFILDQIKISENHAATQVGDVPPCAGLVGPGANQIPEGGNSRELPWGLRTVDGTCNNLMGGQEDFGAADQVFPRRVAANFVGGEDSTFDSDGPGPATAGQPTSYAEPGNVFDSRPRTISNLIVDQTNHNPAAVAAAGADPSAQKSNQPLFIPNVATDVGLSAPFNSVFTLFGQFFDHGLDLVTKSGGTVFMPLKDDDPLVLGPDGQAGTQDDLPANQRFMVLSRSVTPAGPDGVVGTEDDGEAANLTTPFVDQNQTYTSHPAHQAFLREYELVNGRPVATGRLLEGAAGGMATWADVKLQARTILGIELDDRDALNVPLLATDPYGNFKPKPGGSGFPQLVTANGLVEGSLTTPADASAAVKTGHAFLVDIAHHAVPVGRAGQQLAEDGDGGTTDDHLSGTYDNEMLDRHFVAGDGRVNENIGLTSIHHVFHSEHNRLMEDIDGLIGPEGTEAFAAWHDTSNNGAWAYGERLFQAAKFVTEMEYQHLVFEEFARKVQPMVNLFGEGGTGYDTSVNPAIKAEFAHAVYRFGHSMLTEKVARRNAPDGDPGTDEDNSTDLLDAFLNPPEFTDGGPALTEELTAAEAAGSVFRGMSRQVGNEIDEFVTPALRNNLLGLPLDLAAINMARAREAGVPTLNQARREFYAESNNTALRPYESWADFAFALKHRESLVNFVAAYGTHPVITDAATLAGKRDAAVALVYGPGGPDGIVGDDPLTLGTNERADDPQTPAPADRLEFMNSRDVPNTPNSTLWANDPQTGATVTGVDAIDLWVGGLAEKRMVFGGMLGSTFNYVFELQMEDLQFGDRFYYLSRTAGLNLLTQLEGNSFAELVMRNTDVSGLPADAFSRPDYVFNVGALGNTGAIQDDPETDYNENDRSQEPGADLGRTPDGDGVRYSGPAHAVFNGTANGDEIWSSEGDDTVRGNDGDDWVQGGDGVDNLIGGKGDDTLVDEFGDDTIKGGDGDDAISSGQGFGGDLNQGGLGKDFIQGGNDTTETFAGPGDDFVFAGQADDTVFGDDGDDWVEGGKGPFNLLQGDNGNPFQDDPNGGHDVIDGDGGEQDMDAEGGDDIMLAGPGIQRAEGMLGFDWFTHKGDANTNGVPQPADSDMKFTGLLPPSLEALRDRFDLVEGLSGWHADDVLRGDNVGQAPPPPGAPEPEAPEVDADPAQNTLTPAGIARIQGLGQVVPGGASASFNSGNIILGGGGSDILEGRGGDDVLDGDKWLNVRLSVRNNAGTEVRSADTMAELQRAVFAGDIDPGNIVIVREILTGPAATDTAVFSDVRQNYDCFSGGNELSECPTPESTEWQPGAPLRVVHAAGTLADGTDRLRNIEELVFGSLAAPTNVTATAANQSATVQWSAPITESVEGFEVEVLDATGQPLAGQPLRRVSDPEATSLVVAGLTNGQTYRFRVRAFSDTLGEKGPFSVPSNEVTPEATAPAAPRISTTLVGDGQVTLTWTRPADNGSPITGFEVIVRDAAGRVLQRLQADAVDSQITVPGLTNGEQYWFAVAAINAKGRTESAEVTAVPATTATAPAIGTASARDRAAIVRWQAPADTGGAAVTGYQVRVIDDAGAQVGRLRSASVIDDQLRVGGLANGETYRFQVAAENAAGVGAFSRPSNAVTPGTRPDAPVIRRARAGAAGGRLTATARWSPPRTETLPAVTAYRVTAIQVASRADGAGVLDRFRSPVLNPGRRSYAFVLPEGLYRFEVRAYNAFGPSPLSGESNAVRAR